MKRLALFFGLTLFAVLGFWISSSPPQEEPVAAALAKRALQIQKSAAFSLRKKEISASGSEVAAVSSSGKEEDSDPADRCLRRLAAEAERSGEPDRLLEKLGVGFWLTSKVEVIPEKIDVTKSSAYEIFSYALGWAGLLEGRKFPRQDDARALGLLEELHRRDPENSAPLIYMAIIKERAGDSEAAQALFQKIDQETSRYDSYLKSFSRETLGKAATPGELMESYSILGQAPIPNLITVRDALKSKKGSVVPEQLMADGLRTNSADLLGIQWIPLEYAIGRAVTGDSNFPTMKEIIEQRTDRLRLDADHFMKELTENCDLQSQQRWLDEVHHVLSSGTEP